MMKRAYLHNNGRVTLPLEWRHKHGLKKGDKVSFVETENGLIVVPVTESSGTRAHQEKGS